MGAKGAGALSRRLRFDKATGEVLFIFRFFIRIWVSIISFAVCIDMPQKSGTRWAQEVWQVRAHSVMLVSINER